jgi:hypothetical protein
MSETNDLRLDVELLDDTRGYIRGLWKYQKTFAKNMHDLDSSESAKNAENPPERPKEKLLSEFLNGKPTNRHFIKLTIRTLRESIPKSASSEEQKQVWQLAKRLEKALNERMPSDTGYGDVIAGLGLSDQIVVQPQVSEKTHFRPVVEHTGYECEAPLNRPSVHCVPFETPPWATPDRNTPLEASPRATNDHAGTAPKSGTVAISTDPSAFTFGDAAILSCIAGAIASLIAHACGEPDSTHAGHDAIYLQIVQGFATGYITYRTFQSIQTPPQEPLLRGLLLGACVLMWFAYFYLGIYSGEPIGLTLRNWVRLPFPGVGSVANAISTLVHTTLFCVLAVCPAYAIAYGPFTRVIAR